MTKKIRVMHIINNLEIGGAERILALLLKHLSANENLELYLVSLEGHGPLEEEVRKLKVHYKKFSYHLFIPYLNRFDLFFRFRLFFYVLKIKPDILHGHLIRGEDFAKVLGGLLRIPVVITLHDIMIKPRKIELFLNKYLTKAVGVSEQVGDYLEETFQVPKDKIEIIPDAIELKEFKDSVKPFDPKNPVFLYVGRIFKEKGLEFAIEGLAKLVKDYPYLKFFIYGNAGNKEYLRKIENLIKENNWEFVKLIGPTNNVPNALSKGDVFILASKSEGFSMAVLEACVSRKPIIATKTGAIPKMLADGESGIFVKYGDSEEIYRAAKRILDENLVASFGERSYEMVKDKFNIEKVAKMYYNLYLSIVS